MTTKERQRHIIIFCIILEVFQQPYASFARQLRLDMFALLSLSGNSFCFTVSKEIESKHEEML